MFFVPINRKEQGINPLRHHIPCLLRNAQLWASPHINLCNLETVVNLRFNSVLEDRRSLWAYAASRDVSLLAHMLHRDRFRKQKALGQAIWESTSTCNCLGSLFTVSFVISTFIIRGFWNDSGLCPSCQWEKLLFCSLFSASPKSYSCNICTKNSASVEHELQRQKKNKSQKPNKQKSSHLPFGLVNTI